MSIGCGPCSEAFAFNTFFDNINFNKKEVTFIGFDTNTIWNNVQNKVKALLPFLDIITQNCFNHIACNDNFIFPNILILNYLLSDISKQGCLSQFILDVVTRIIDKMPSDSIVIVNDINHYSVRNYYKTLIQRANERNELKSAMLSFIVNYENSNYKCESYKYSYFNIFHKFNELAIKALVSLYGTKTSCTSSQLTMYKNQTKYDIKCKP
jgi:hypothetical protein